MPPNATAEGVQALFNIYRSRLIRLIRNDLTNRIFNNGRLALLCHEMTLAGEDTGLQVLVPLITSLDISRNSSVRIR